MIKNSIFVFCFFLCSSLGFSQDIDKIKTEFEYLRLPFKPLNKEIKNYTSKVILGYASKVSGDKEDAEKKFTKDTIEYSKKVAEAEIKYQADMEEYRKQKKEAEAKYAKEKSDWDKKSTGTKFLEKSLLEESKPRLQLPAHPYKNIPVRPVLVNPESAKIQKMFNTDELASTLLRLDGYENSKDNAVNIIVTMMGFEYIDPPVMDVKEASIYNTKSGTTVNEKTYTYSLSYKHPMSVRLETAKGVVMDEYIEAFNNFSIVKSAGYKTLYELEQWWNKNQDGYLANLVEKAGHNNLKYIDTLLNSNYGNTKLKPTTEIRLVKDKKVNYDDFQQAYESAAAGYNVLAETQDKSTAMPAIQKAIELWEAALKESNVEDKKARIDADVTMATMFNLVEASIWADNYTRASALLAKLNAMDPSKKERKEGEEMNELMKGQKKRYEANR